MALGLTVGLFSGEAGVQASAGVTTGAESLAGPAADAVVTSDQQSPTPTLAAAVQSPAPRRGGEVRQNSQPASSSREESARRLSGAEATAPRLTPLDTITAGRCLAHAWHSRTGRAVRGEGLAILLSHWALETARGARMVEYNFGGLKGVSPSGRSVRLWTRELKQGRVIRVRRRFRSYESLEAGAEDYLDLLARRYRRAFRAVERGRLEAFVRALERGGYFTEDAGSYLRAMRGLWHEFIPLAREHVSAARPSLAALLCKAQGAP